jgi:hypothetical protein
LRSTFAPGLYVLILALIGGPAFASDTPEAEKVDYRTIVIFGDTQELVDGARSKPGDLYYPGDPAGRENLENLKRTIDWVIGNREAENIDFVFHVGDIIQDGHALLKDPLPECYVEGICQKELKNEQGRRKCRCGSETRADEQWERFNWLWKRLDGVVPYAIVRGNHDNIGSDQPNVRPGFRDYYGAKQMAKLPGYLESSPFEDVGHVWKFQLGAFPVLVLGLPDSAIRSEEQVQWASDLLDHPEYRELPTIFLMHRLFNGVPVDYTKPFLPWRKLISQRPEQIFMTVWGHVSPGRIRMLDLSGKEVLDIRSNWQVFKEGPRAALVNLVRFKLGEDGIESVSIEAFTPTLGFEKSDWLAPTRMQPRPFRVPLKGLR